MEDRSEIDMETLRDWLESGKPVEVIDIRPAVDFTTWSIPGSCNIDAYQAFQAGSPGVLQNYHSPPEVPVVVVCFTGRTSKLAAQYLRSLGIPAISLAGGMHRWSIAWNTADLYIPNSSARVIQVRRTGKGCLSYLVGSGNVALVIDPSVEPQVYLELAEKNGWRITEVLDTHIHADHLSRSSGLAKLTGSTYYLPSQERAVFEYCAINHGETIEVGNAQLKAYSTPGHTKESMSFLLDHKGLFTGDTLFIDSVGRPDLNASFEETQIRARLLYESLQRFRKMNQSIMVLPCHTNRPVQFDGMPIAATLGAVFNRNPVLDFDEEKFANWILGRIPPTPPNYDKIVSLNEQGKFPDSDPDQLEAGANHCAVR